MPPSDARMKVSGLLEDKIVWSRLSCWDMRSGCSSSGCCHINICASSWHSVMGNAGDGGSNSLTIVVGHGNLVESMLCIAVFSDTGMMQGMDVRSGSAEE